MVAQEHGTADRYRLLESIRQYARDKLEAVGEADTVRTQQLDFFLQLTERAKPEELDTRLLARLGQEYDNVRAALRWSIENNDAERALRLAGALWGFWFVRGCYAEGRAWLNEVLALPSDTNRTALRARALHTASHLANCQGDYGAATALLDESRAISEELGDQPGVATSLHLLANIRRALGDLTTARSLYEEARALNRLAGNSAAEILNLLQLADVAYQQGEYAEAHMLAFEGLTRSTDHGHRWGIARALHVRGQIAATEKDFEDAQALHERSLAIQQELGDQQGQARTLAALAWVALCRGDADQARLHYEASLRVARGSEERLEIARGLEGLADLDSRVDPERALRLAGAAGALRKSMGAEPYPEERRRLQGWLNVVYAARGEKVCAEARAAGRSTPLPQVIAYALERSAASG